MNYLFDWLITSSADPKKTGIAVYGVLSIIGSQLLHITGVLCTLSLYCFAIDQTVLTDMIAAIVSFVETALLLVGITFTIFGLMRKVVLGRWAAPQR